MMPVQSSAISKIGYDTEANILFIEFNKNSKYPTYQYGPIGAHTAGRMFKAASIGVYFHRYIKNRTEYVERSDRSLEETMNYRKGTDIMWTAAKRYASSIGLL
jgi:hypothetical protein